MCYCFLCISVGLFSHENSLEKISKQKTLDVQPMNRGWHTKEHESSKQITSTRIITPENLKKLKKLIQDTKFSGVVYLSDEKTTYRICSEKFESMQEDELIFAIHSIGKVYTGILTLIMLQNGVIDEKDLFAPLEVDTLVLQALPLSVQRQMRTTTLYDTMIHKGGFCDYLRKYFDFIRESLERTTTPPVLQKPEAFLPFADAKIVNLNQGATHYSNLGTLLVGLSIQHHYQKVEPLDYNAILKKHILDKAGIISFFISRPDNGHFNENDPVAKYICGSPAGGYWTTVKDLHKFGQWIKNKCEQEPDFMYLMESYGQEFYSTTHREIRHGGGISSSSAFLSVLLDSNNTIAIASDKNDGNNASIYLYNEIIRNILTP